MHCDPATNPALAYYVCNTDPPGGRTFITTDADGYTISIGPGQCCFVSAIVFCTLKMGNISWLDATDICQDEFANGCTVGGVCIPPWVVGVSASGVVSSGGASGSGGHSNTFDEIVQANVAGGLAFNSGTQLTEAFTYGADFLANTQWYQFQFGFIAQTIILDNHNGDQDYYFFVPNAANATPQSDGAAGASGIVHAGELKSWDDQQGLASSIYIQPVTDNVEVSDGDGLGSGAKSYISAFAT